MFAARRSSSLSISANCDSRFVAIDGMVGVEVVDRASGIDADLPEISAEALRLFGEEKDVGSERLHQDAITNGSGRRLSHCGLQPNGASR